MRDDESVTTDEVSDDAPTAAGVIGVGHMGRNHVRVYDELPGVDLVGVADADSTRAESIAAAHGTVARSQEDLLAAADLVSVAVPTSHHAPIVRDCIDAGVDALVEKPFVDDLDAGRELASRAAEAGVTIQVGHVERFNPAIDALAEILQDLDVIAIEAHRLGPPLDRELDDSVVMDLMIHDVDVLLSLVDADLDTVSACGTRGTQYATANLRFENGVVANLTASRLTQKKIRTLSVTATDCRIDIDYTSQSVHIHRNSLPEYVKDDGEIRYRHESIVEEPMVERSEPLRDEIASFIEASREGTTPRVTAEDALRAIEVTCEIDRQAMRSERREEVIQQ
ncbi:Gfo/Idh/MocA family protein [Halegenticoccus tardaugens]|uniref:Gfo/Idh/MocA family protein n=1 Tax=Halegenticoccus tardaugens TaxID=2071624 RepID=UPI00100A7101|nr:Gfo/Idh/MocA family oxidoreductase [Halegenticoccus tardaugens]